MSLNGSSYMMVNTTREEGYDIQLRFKTTLPNGLLAIGKGSTFYILELNQGRLNLHSSLLNKWEGVFIGSSLNDSNWQKVIVIFVGCRFLFRLLHSFFLHCPFVVSTL